MAECIALSPPPSQRLLVRRDGFMSSSPGAGVLRHPNASARGGLLHGTRTRVTCQPAPINRHAEAGSGAGRTRGVAVSRYDVLSVL